MGALIILYFLLFPSVVHQVSPEKHSLHCLFIGLSTPDTFSGSVFSGLCVYDDIKIIHYSNEEQDWKIKSQNAEIRGHLKLYKDWFQFYPKNLLLQVNILSNCTNYKCSELHVLQRRAGCDVEKLNGTIKYLTVFNEYQYDGEDFIAFNFNTTQWINTNPKAKETKLKWDSQTTRNHVIKDQLKICMNWISTFNNTQRTRPDVEVFAVESPQDQNKLILTCLATGFYPKHLEMNMMLNGIKLDHVNSSGIRPNGDETFQLRISVEIHRNETEGFECHVNHISVKEPVISEWDGKCRNCSEASRTNIITIIVAAVAVTVAVTVFMIVICVCIHKRKRSNEKEWSRSLEFNLKSQNQNEEFLCGCSGFSEMLEVTGGFSGMIRATGSFSGMIRATGGFSGMIRATGGFSGMIRSTGTYCRKMEDRVRPVLDAGSVDEISKHQSMDNITNVHETQSLYDIRLNPAEDLTAARGIMGSNNSLPNFAMKKDSSDPHQNTVTQKTLQIH
ncbi:zinc-alpha-2-glycoprotein-like isoform X2 [Xyrauchen texanus]|uniref:zinc-alpha-2-glycoprotein-like isoform X2 n=1 Tax=Xyrauchen texanus TaxID=154827 RepID=UPI002241B042|nr:zinc-alpha-2-glycoprotein-like isoform X2 [Xyrauchen texanus]